MGKAKPFDIPKREVWEAFKRVKANQGAAGVDAQSIAAFEVDLSNNPEQWSRRVGTYGFQAILVPLSEVGLRARRLDRFWHHPDNGHRNSQ